MPSLVSSILQLILISSILFSAVFAAGNEPWLDDAYPTPYAGPVLETGTNAAHWLILGAFVIVLIIFLGVAFRRPKS